MKPIRIGSRDSKLAVAQARILMDTVGRKYPHIPFEIVTMKTTGDLILDKTVDQIGGKGLFVKELDLALLEGRVDLCVHSFKDMPTEDNPDLPIVAVSVREDPRDVLLLPRGEHAEASRPVGCSSQRRQIQFRQIYPGWDIRPVRGNVLTRIEKLDRGEYSGLVLAAAGILRLDLWHRVDRVFSVEEILPCPCQGILAVQARAGTDTGYLEAFHDPDAWDVSLAERAYLRALGGGCSSPSAAYGQTAGELLLLQGLHVDGDGQVYKETVRGRRVEAEALGEALAERLLVRAKRGVAVG